MLRAKKSSAVLLHGDRPPTHRLHSPYFGDQVRRLADVVFAGGLLFLAAPLMLLVALAIRFEGLGPVLERHRCIAAGGRCFHMLTFRTAQHDPDRTLPRLEQSRTRLGQFLHHTCIDALPQLFNVLRGELSLTDPERRSPSFLD